METVYAYIFNTVLSFGIVYMLNYIIKLNKKHSKKLNLIDYKHEAWIQAYQKHTNNGLLEDYNIILNDFIKQDNFINDIKD